MQRFMVGASLVGALVLSSMPAHADGRWVIFYFDSYGQSAYGQRYGFTGMGRGASLELSPPQLLQLMGDPLYSVDGRRRAARELREQGWDAVPYLIEHLGDRRVYQPAVAGRNGGKGKAGGLPDVDAEISVGAMCDDVLYQIITPKYDSPHRKLVAKPKSASIYRVADWRAWWAANRSKGLARVHREMKAVVDTYWLAGCEEQVLGEDRTPRAASPG